MNKACTGCLTDDLPLDNGNYRYDLASVAIAVSVAARFEPVIELTNPGLVHSKLV